MAKNQSTVADNGTSVFDPCLCEMNYMWFTAEGDSVIDPFAGGSVRGIVASEMGRSYTGIELRGEQVEENRKQASSICADSAPVWINGDSMDIDEHVGGAMFDHLFTCPPYGSLEVYSDDPRDLSNCGDSDFDGRYAEILRRAVDHLKDDRFATIVVGNYRDCGGFMRDLCGITVRAMEDAGCRFYNDMILVNPCGSLPIRVPKQFNASRKIGKRHQYVLNFVKGDPVRATKRLGDVVIPDLSQEE